MMNNVPQSVSDWLAEQQWGAVTGTGPVGGGCINNAMHLETEHGPPALLKSNARAPDDMFAREAEGLAALAEADGGPRVPAVYAAGATWLLVEFIPSGRRQPDYGRQLGEQLARLHATHGPSFGFEHDNYIGSTPQPNPWTEDGYAFFAEQRLGFQVRLARHRSRLSSSDVSVIERVITRLPELIPAQPPSLIHGDLWGGNAMIGPQGEPVLIDPAAHYGWAEADMAMTTLFGGFSGDVYPAWEANARPAPGYRERFDLYNLYHLLNHLNLFGPGYYSQVMTIARRYA